MVMNEREALAQTAKELLSLLRAHDAVHFVDLPDTKAGRDARLEIDKKVLELSMHLANIAGFCDGNSRRAIHVFTTGILDVSMLRTWVYPQLKALLPTIIGMQVDYTKKPPFQLLGLDIRVLEGRVKAKAERS